MVFVLPDAKPLRTFAGNTSDRQRQQQGAPADHDDGDPMDGGKLLAEKQHGEDGDEHDAQLVDRRDLSGLADLQRAEIAEPGRARRQPRWKVGRVFRGRQRLL